VMGLFTHRGGVRSAASALLTGIAVWILGAYILAFPYPYITSLAAALIAYLTVSYIEPPARMYAHAPVMAA
jgi:hypothetical protein